jgi:hypothetical protein
LIAKTASDLMSKWVGDNEKNIAAAFEEAAAEDGCGPQLFGTASDPSVIRLIREHYGMMGRC